MIDKTAWSGNCQDCATIFVVAPHDETPYEVVGQIAEGPNEWEFFSSCFVCGGSIDWNGSDLLPLTVR